MLLFRYGLYFNIFGHLLEFLRFVFWMLEVTGRIRLERKNHRFPKEPMIYLPSTDGFERSACPPHDRVLVDRANYSCGFKQITKNTRGWGWNPFSVWETWGCLIDSGPFRLLSCAARRSAYFDGLCGLHAAGAMEGVILTAASPEGRNCLSVL